MYPETSDKQLFSVEVDLDEKREVGPSDVDKMFLLADDSYFRACEVSPKY